MNKITSILFLLLAMSMHCFAAPRTKAEAKAIADKLAAKIGTVVYYDAVSERKAPVRKAGTDETEAYYVFDYGENEGFIIVSGDDRMPAIVGYTDTGAFDESNMPVQLKDFLDAYTNTVAAVIEGDVRATENANAASSAASVTPVAPLLGSIAWNQDSPYNLMCPTINGEHCVTGCAATAAAQIMRYHKYPVNQVGIAGYTTAKYGLVCRAISASTAVEDQYDWDNMLPVYTSSATEQQQNAVAKLMYHIGVAMQMDYGLSSTGGSGAYYEANYNAFKTFGYDTSLLQSVYRSNYTYSEWRNIIIRELNAKRPISYNGQSSGGGHSFVCDGIDADGLVHINWGWGGSDNGYFDVAVLNPGDNSGIGASSSTDGYNGNNMMVVGITPSNTAGETKINSGTTPSSDWNNLTVAFANDQENMLYNANYTLYNKLNVSIKNNSDKDFYGGGYVSYTVDGGKAQNLSYIYVSLVANETKEYTFDVIAPSGANSVTYTLGNASKAFTVSAVADPAISVTSVTCNTSGTETHEITYMDETVIVPCIKNKIAEYTVTLNNDGGYYRGQDIFFGFWVPSSSAFNASKRTIELPHGTTTLTFTDNNLIYGEKTGMAVWCKNGFSYFNPTSASYSKSDGSGSIGWESRYLFYAEGPTKEVAITDANHSINDHCYYATLYLDYAVTIPDGVDAYTAQIKSNNEVVMTKIMDGVIPAYTGVVLEMNGTGNYDFPATNADVTIGSDLQGVLTDTRTTSVSGNVYVLNIQNGNPVFSQYTGTTIWANKAYLIFPSSAKKCVFRFFDDDVDAIHSTMTSAEKNSQIYNLEGMQVKNPTKGLYIANGKKFIIK